MAKRQKAEYLARKLFNRKLPDYHWKIIELLNRPESYLDEYIEAAKRYDKAEAAGNTPGYSQVQIRKS